MSEETTTTSETIQNPKLHELSAENSKYRQELRDTKALNETLTGQLKASRDATLSAALASGSHVPNTGADEAIVSALDAEKLWASGTLDNKNLQRQLDSLADAKPYLFSTTAEQELKLAKLEVTAAHPEVDEAAFAFCPATDPDEVRAWGDTFAEYLKAHAPKSTDTDEMDKRSLSTVEKLSQLSGSGSPSHSTPAKGSSVNPLADAVRKQTRR